MPEPRMTTCPACRGKFDLVVYRSCPACRTRNRAQKAGADPAGEPHPRGAKAPQSGKPWHLVSYLVASFLLGAVSFMMFTNYLLGRRLVGVPVIEKVLQQVVVKKASSPSNEQPAAVPANGGPAIQIRTTLQDTVIDLVSWERGEPVDARVPYRGRIQNISPDSVNTVIVTLQGRDAAGKVVAEDFARLEPYALLPLEARSFELHLPASAGARSVRIGVSWSAFFEKELTIAKLEETSSPPSAAGGRQELANLVLKPADGGAPIVVTPEDIRKAAASEGPPPPAVVEFRRALEERKKGVPTLPAEEPQ